MTVKYEKFLLNGVEYKTQLTQKWVNPKKMGRTESLSADFTHSRNHYANRSERGPGSPGRRCSSDSSGYEDE